MFLIFFYELWVVTYSLIRASQNAQQWCWFHSGPENLKKSRQKNSWIQINQKRNILGSLKLFPSSKFYFWPILKLKKKFGPNFILCNFKNDQKSIFELGKKFKTAKNAILRKTFWIYLNSRVFLPGLFKIFWPAVLL